MSLCNDLCGIFLFKPPQLLMTISCNVIFYLITLLYLGKHFIIWNSLIVFLKSCLLYWKLYSISLFYWCFKITRFLPMIMNFQIIKPNRTFYKIIYFSIIKIIPFFWGSGAMPQCLMILHLILVSSAHTVAHNYLYAYFCAIHVASFILCGQQAGMQYTYKNVGKTNIHTIFKIKS